MSPRPSRNFQIPFKNPKSTILNRKSLPLPFTVIFSDNFDGASDAVLNGTTPDITTGGANWVAMQHATNGRIMADGTIDMPNPGGTAANRGGSATLAFTPTVGFIYTLDLSAVSLNSSASHTTANRLYFGFAKGQSAGNGSATQMTATAATVQGQVTQGFMTKVGYTGANTNLGAPNISVNDSTSIEEWDALSGAFGGSIDLRIVLDTTGANRTATWYAKRPTASDYSLTRATENVIDTDITSVGFGLVTFTSGRVSSFSLIREAGTEPGGYSAWAAVNGAGPNLDDDHDGDGVPNGIEYFIGGPNGNTTGFTALPGVDDDAGTLSVTWTKGTDYAGVYGSDFWVETSATLADPWTMETVGDNVMITGNDVTYTFPAGTRNFARLKVTGP